MERASDWASIASAIVLLLVGCSDRPATQPSAKGGASVSVEAIKLQSDFALPAHTDENWVNGVAKGWGAAYFVMLAPGTEAAMATGNEVTFADGTKRRIESTRVNGETLIVNLDGTPLDGRSVGHPNKIRVDRPKQ
ncbi:MAG: hypothetical protein ACK50G_01855 [bacterium]|jgi:hypothetical protein